MQTTKAPEIEYECKDQSIIEEVVDISEGKKYHAVNKTNTFFAILKI